MSEMVEVPYGHGVALLKMLVGRRVVVRDVNASRGSTFELEGVDVEDNICLDSDAWFVNVPAGGTIGVHGRFVGPRGRRASLATVANEHLDLLESSGTKATTIADTCGATSSRTSGTSTWRPSVCEMSRRLSHISGNPRQTAERVQGRDGP
jgi:hypothetical protein